MLPRLVEWLSDSGHRTWIGAVLFALALLIGVVAYLRAAPPLSAADDPNDPRNQAYSRWWAGTDEDRQKLVTHHTEVCPGAPLLLPAAGYIGLLYGDPRAPYSESHRHQGVDIFSLTGPGLTPIVAAYDGYLTRESYWISALIIRVPSDPLNPGRQIWLYYAHMADASGVYSTIDPAYPPDTHEVFVKQGTHLGYTGNYSGNILNPVAVHLHFSIVLDNGFGGYRNELEFDNTIDSSRYLGIPVNYGCAPAVPDCAPDPLCKQALLSSAGG